MLQYITVKITVINVSLELTPSFKNIILKTTV